MRRLTKTIDDYPEYRFHLIDNSVVIENFIVDTSHVYDVATEYDARLNIRIERGKWVKRTLAKIALDAFGIHINQRAVYARGLDFVKYFSSTESAARWIKRTQKPVFSGKPVGLKAVSKNISNCLKQPDVYPLAYGYEWYYSSTKEVIVPEITESVN